jgi:hypothetical protein
MNPMSDNFFECEKCKDEYTVCPGCGELMKRKKNNPIYPRYPNFPFPMPKLPQKSQPWHEFPWDLKPYC